MIPDIWSDLQYILNRYFHSGAYTERKTISLSRRLEMKETYIRH